MEVGSSALKRRRALALKQEVDARAIAFDYLGFCDRLFVDSQRCRCDYLQHPSWSLYILDVCVMSLARSHFPLTELRFAFELALSYGVRTLTKGTLFSVACVLCIKYLFHFHLGRRLRRVWDRFESVSSNLH